MSLDGFDSWNLAQVRELRTISRMLLETAEDRVHAQIKNEATAKIILRKGFRLYQSADSGAHARPFMIVGHAWEPTADWMLKDRWPVVMDKDVLVGFKRTAHAAAAPVSL